MNAKELIESVVNGGKVSNVVQLHESYRDLADDLEGTKDIVGYLETIEGELDAIEMGFDTDDSASPSDVKKWNQNFDKMRAALSTAIKYAKKLPRY